MMRQSAASVILAVLTVSTAEAQTTTTTAPATTFATSSITTSPALAVGPSAGLQQTFPTPPALGASQALPGAGSSAAAPGPSYAPAWVLCLPDAPVSETLIFGTELSCAP
jgi:hypothetical protein